MKSENRPCNSAPASITYRQRKEARKNDNQSDGCIPKPEINRLDLQPVLPFSSGEGLPYAPINWPCPGDIWRWKVGRRYGKTGFYFDRFLYAPERLQKPGCPKLTFGGRIPLEQYIRTEFPGEDVEAFFALFSWKVPAKMINWSEENTAPPPQRVPHRMREEKDEDNEWDEEEETTASNPRKRKRKPAPVPPPSTCRRQTRQSFKRYFPSKTNHEPITIDLTEMAETSDSSTMDTSSASDSETDQGNQNSVSSACCSIGTSHSHVASRESVMDAHQEPVESNSEDPEYYLNSVSQDASSLVTANEMDEDQIKLSSLLAMDFPILMSTENLTELTNLLSKMKEDPHLSLDQLLKLHMIEDIPLIGKKFVEAKQDMEGDECYANCETNIANLICLNKKYKQSKEKAAQLQAEIDLNISAKREAENQIVQLQSRCAELANEVADKMLVKDNMLSDQRSMADSLESVMQKVELGKSKKQEWELKKANAAKHVAEILAKYAS